MGIYQSTDRRWMRDLMLQYYKELSCDEVFIIVAPITNIDSVFRNSEYTPTGGRLRYLSHGYRVITKCICPLDSLEYIVIALIRGREITVDGKHTYKGDCKDKIYTPRTNMVTYFT